MTAEKMAEYLWGLPEQFRVILEQGVKLPARYKREYHNLVVTGLGGSAIGGDILRTWALARLAIPVLVNRDYDLPGFVNQDSLVVAVSYSGQTEETLSAYQQAVDRGAAVIVVTSGGRLADMAAQDDCAVVRIPGGLSPRAASGYLFAPLALILEELGLVEGAVRELEETVQVLLEVREGINPEVEGSDNLARQIALDLQGNLAVIWGSSAHSEIAAMRWKTQINENAKTPAYFNIFPELNHNEIVGFEAPADLLARLVVIILRDPEDHPRVQRRIDISTGIIRDRVHKIIEVPARGQSWLARFYSLVYVGDYASYYLAQAYGINPTPVAVIDYLKAELAKG
jgi:glucose/mannose-6-phosphate isomerase